MHTGKRVLFVEFNEISWSVIDQLTSERGPTFLPNLQYVRQHGTWGSPTALEKPPHLDPWVTWVTVHTGVTQDVHGAKVLEQDANTVGATRSWEYAEQAGKSIGIFGSIGSFPPKARRGFVVPGPFAPASDTAPPELRPIQELNRDQTQAHGNNHSRESIVAMAQKGLALLRFGLSLSTCLAIAQQLVRERINPKARWRRVILQPLINFDLFRHLYRKNRPDFATWHSNHAAHYMHHYWRAWSSRGFRSQSSSEERQHFGEAVPLGYKVCDQLLGRFLKMIDPQTTLIVCSSMGQQPYNSDSYQEGKVILRVRDVSKLLELLKAEGVTEVIPTMVPQINLRVPDVRERGALAERIAGMRRILGKETERAVAVEQTGEILTVTPLGLTKLSPGVLYSIPGVTGAIPLETLFAADAPTLKQGMHHPVGLFAALGPDIPARELPTCTNLDIAPTILSLLGVPVPPVMTGRPLLSLS